MSGRGQRLPLATLLLYGAPATALSFCGAWISMYLLKFSTDVLLVPAGVIGAWFGISRVWDALVDPFIGYWSDRTRARMGRRRPWMALAALPAGALVLALWSPPAALSGGALASWIGAAILLYFTASSAFGVPYAALGAELAPGYHERTRLFGVRAAFDMGGVFLGAGAIFLLERADDERATAAAIAVAGALGCALLLGGSALGLREPARVGRADVGSASKSFGDVLRNPHARLLLAIYFLDQIGFGVLITLLPYLTEYVLELPGSTAQFVAGALVAMLLGLPVWIALSRRYGKRGPWVVSMLAKAGAYASLLFVAPGDMVWMSIATLVIGATHGAGIVLGPSIQADVIDFDEQHTRERKEGTYFAAWSVAAQGASGAGVLLAGLVLQSSGFDPNAAQPDSVRLALRIAAAGSPFLFHALAAAMLWRFRLGEREHAAIRAELDQRLISSPLHAEGRR
jgi:Na+/melibiose symporter-like transporter